MAKFTTIHIHLRSPDPKATASYYEKMFGAEVIRTMQGASRALTSSSAVPISSSAPVASGDGVNPPPAAPIGARSFRARWSSGIDAVVAELKAKGAEFSQEPHRRFGPACASPSCGPRRAVSIEAARPQCRLRPAAART